MLLKNSNIDRTRVQYTQPFPPYLNMLTWENTPACVQISPSAAEPGLQHKICHALGGRLNSAHADTHSVILPHVVALNAGCGHDWVDRVRPMLGQDPAERLLELAGASDLPTNLAELGARQKDLRTVAEDVAGSPNPVPVDAERIEKLLEQALGTPPEGVA
jgi:alcohol dehydrogenase class IV